ncbi:MAG TPA: hypothetical protein VHO70_03740 [Chitinispirillaceae bacterium]|nr:hypothetical protein [Chitinispirillaceae bacterium]
MKKIPVDQVQDGMILFRDICGPSGSILLSKGTVITPALGRRLKNWGIAAVVIEGEEESTLEQKEVLVPAEELKTQIQTVFSDVLDNPLMKKIFIAAYQYRLHKN